MPKGHRAFVESWLARRASGSAPLLATEALDAVWERAQRSLSRLSLAALMRCAVETAAAQFPRLADVRIGPAGFEPGVLLQAPPAELLASLGGLLVEILALVEETSGKVLAPALESELLRVSSGRRGTPPGGSRPVTPG